MTYIMIRNICLAFFGKTVAFDSIPGETETQPIAEVHYSKSEEEMIFGQNSESRNDDDITWSTADNNENNDNDYSLGPYGSDSEYSHDYHHEYDDYGDYNYNDTYYDENHTYYDDNDELNPMSGNFDGKEHIYPLKMSKFIWEKIISFEDARPEKGLQNSTILKKKKIKIFKKFNQFLQKWTPHTLS